MDILLQNKKTRNYVRSSGGWTAERQQAHLFDTGVEAMFFCLHCGIHDMQIVGEFADERLNFSLAVTDLRMG